MSDAVLPDCNAASALAMRSRIASVSAPGGGVKRALIRSDWEEGCASTFVMPTTPTQSASNSQECTHFDIGNILSVGPDRREAHWKMDVAGVVEILDGAILYH